jgi:hypothetical protein
MQALSLADKASFRNCLVAMRPRTTKADMPSAHDVATFIHNEFVVLLDKFKRQISVRLHAMDLTVCIPYSVTSRKCQGRSL